MAIPTITSLTPVLGPASGRNLVKIVGTNFKLPVPLARGPNPGPPVATVRVTFGGEAALWVDVYSATALGVLVPPYRGDADAAAFAAVAVVVQNLDAAGAPIPGESATKSAAYTYERLSLRAPAKDPILVRTAGELVFALRRQVHPNVDLAVHSDFGDVGATTIRPAKLPALFLDGPRLSWDAPRDSVERRADRVQQLNGDAELRWPERTVALEFGVVGISDNVAELLALANALTELGERTPWLDVDKDSSDASRGRDRFELELEGPPDVALGPNEGDLQTFRATLRVLDVPISIAEPFAETTRVTASDLEVQALDPAAAAAPVATLAVTVKEI